jgi:hypothetical protein
MPQLNSRHTTQVDVQHKTSGIPRVRVIKKCFGAFEYQNIKSMDLQQPLDRSEHAAIIINDKY